KHPQPSIVFIAQMNIIDIILLLIISLAIWRGIANGFFVGVARLISWLGSLVLTFLSYHHISELFGAGPTTSVWAVPLSFLLTLLVIGSILSFLSNRMLAAIPAKVHRHRLTKFLGVVPGLATGVLYAAITAALLL